MSSIIVWLIFINISHIIKHCLQIFTCIFLLWLLLRWLLLFLLRSSNLIIKSKLIHINIIIVIHSYLLGYLFRLFFILLELLFFLCQSHLDITLLCLFIKIFLVIIRHISDLIHQIIKFILSLTCHFNSNVFLLIILLFNLWNDIYCFIFYSLILQNMLSLLIFLI